VNTVEEKHGQNDQREYIEEDMGSTILPLSPADDESPIVS
jgi:hypothetical protein